MLVVIDTNILVNALKSKDNDSLSVRFIRDVMNGAHKMCISQAIFDEYQNVLRRPQLMLNKDLVDSFLATIWLNSFRIEPLPTNDSLVTMIDEDDRKFFDVARCLNARLITRNIKHYPVHELITSLEEIYRA